ncbi:MAG: DNA/RNA nuclease SfsA [Eubacteriales bacterium]|nr:DNA/RNA nuclease SfsA [Eubacteriales bacterium]
MKYENIIEGNFISRPNRFIANVLVNGHSEKAHVKNTGRCRELLTDNAKIYLEDFADRMGKRKMRYSLISVLKGQRLINMDSQAPNKIIEEGLNTGKLCLPNMDEINYVRRETSFGQSRFDFYVESIDGQKGFVEVKGVTLEDGGIVRFPDAPTDRGVKHVKELILAAKDGYRAYVIFVIQMKGVKWFQPNDDTHKEFGDALRSAKKQGVEVLAYDCIVGIDSLTLNEEVEVRL